MQQPLTPREFEVLMHVREGDSSQNIAEMLSIHKRTVDFHLRNIFEKLQVSNRMQACRQAQKLGLLPGDLP